MAENNSPSGYKKLLADRSSRKLLLFSGVVILGAISYVMFFAGSSEEAERSRLRSAPSEPGGSSSEQVDPAYEQALRQADRQRIEEARGRGDSAMPSLIGESTGQRLPSSLDDSEEMEELEPEPEREKARPRLPEAAPPTLVPLPEPPRSEPERPRPEPVRPRPQPQQASFDQNAAAAMERQMQRLMSNSERSYSAAQTSYLYSGERANQGGSRPNQGGGGDLTVRPGAPSSDKEEAALPFDLPLAGTVLYAEMVSRANSDAPGPVLARVLEGPFAGATVIGSFQVAQDALVIRFTSMTVTTTRDGDEVNQTIPINTVAVDTEHVGTAMATDVDRHIFERVATGFATAFISGMGGAIADSGSTTVERSDGSTVSQRDSLNTREQLLVGAGKAAEEVGRVVQDIYGNRPTTITVDSGTPIGLLFL